MKQQITDTEKNSLKQKISKCAEEFFRNFENKLRQKRTGSQEHLLDRLQDELKLQEFEIEQLKGEVKIVSSLDIKDNEGKKRSLISATDRLEQEIENLFAVKFGEEARFKQLKREPDEKTIPLQADINKISGEK